MGRERGEGLEGAIGPHVPWISIAANSPVGSTGIIPRPGGTTEERSVFGDCTSCTVVCRLSKDWVQMPNDDFELNESRWENWGQR